MGHLEAVCWKCQPQLAPRWFVDKLGRGDAVSQPLPHVKGGDRDAATASRSASEAAIWRDFNAEKRLQGKGRQEHYAKTTQMITAALNDNLDCEVNHACAIAALQDEIDCRDEEMDEAERNEREAIRKPCVPASTSPLSHTMLAASSMSAVDSFGVDMGGAPGSMPRHIVFSVPTHR